MLVLAAAGTGKTRTLVHRVAYLVEQGVPPDRILLLTFTNRAAREMLERAEQVVHNVGGIWSGTFHHICAKFLRRYGSFIGFKPGFTILDEDDQKKLMAQCIKDNVKNVKDFQKKDFLLSVVSDAANRGIDLEKLVESYQTKMAIDVPEVLKVCRAYHAKKLELGAMDFDDLLVNGLRLLNENARIRELLQEHFLHVLVDEYQDTNTIQAQITDLIAAKHRNIMVVGDDFQCIYTWRGAEFENIMNFPKRWDGCRIVKLERNYRSLAPILDVANIVMKDVQHQFEKTLRPFRSDTGVKPRLYHLYDSRAQAEGILKLVGVLRQNGIPYKDIAVLYRSHYTSIDIQMSLIRNRIPFRITSGIGVFEQLHVKDVISYLRLCIDPVSELSFMRLMCLLPGVGEMSARKMWKNLGGAFNGLNPMERLNIGSMMPAKAADGWKKIEAAFSGASDHLKSGMDRLLVEDFVNLFYEDHLNKQFETDEAEQRLEDLTEIKAQIASSAGGLRAFLDEVALMTNLDAKAKASLPEDHMSLTTVHQAKGMEWPVVILPWLVDSIFPSGKSLEAGNIDEERRLFYVAVTRAKDRLYMFAPKAKKTADGTNYPVEQSVFLREIPRPLLEEQSLYSAQPSGMSGGGGFDDDDDDACGNGGTYRRGGYQRREGSYGAGRYGDGTADYGGGGSNRYCGGGSGYRPKKQYKSTWRR